MGTITHHRKDRTTMDRDPRYAGGRIWGLIAYLAAIAVLAILGLTAFTLYMLGVTL